MLATLFQKLRTDSTNRSSSEQNQTGQSSTAQENPTEQNISAPTEFIATTVAKIAVYERGKINGPKILIINGGPATSHEYMTKPLEDLEKDYRLVFIDQLGSGKSKPNDDTELNFNNLARSTAEVIQHYAKKGEYSILTHSFGSLVCAAALRDQKMTRDPKSILFFNPVPLTRAGFDKIGAELAKRVAKFGVIEKLNEFLAEDESPLTWVKKFLNIGQKIESAEPKSQEEIDVESLKVGRAIMRFGLPCFADSEEDEFIPNNLVFDLDKVKQELILSYLDGVNFDYVRPLRSLNIVIAIGLGDYIKISALSKAFKELASRIEFFSGGHAGLANVKLKGADGKSCNNKYINLVRETIPTS